MWIRFSEKGIINVTSLEVQCNTYSAGGYTEQWFIMANNEFVIAQFDDKDSAMDFFDFICDNIEGGRNYLDLTQYEEANCFGGGKQ